MAFKYWDFEKSLGELENRIEELRRFSVNGNTAHREELVKLIRKANKLRQEIYSKLTPWEITLVARHPSRPYTLDYIKEIFDEFVELHGDRLYKDDAAMVGGLARLGERSVVVIGHQKGRNTKERCFRNYGMPHPEGYRKALRLMRIAERFNKPVITFIDTPGAAPDVEAEERGQSEAIARNLMYMSRLKVPVISAVIGEGGSGGALAIGLADRVMMLEYSTYSVISPEGCAAILWKDGGKAELAAKALKMSAKELLKLGIIDRIIKEPVGGAHRKPKVAANNLKTAIKEYIDELSKLKPEKLVASRYEKFRRMGVFEEPGRN